MSNSRVWTAARRLAVLAGLLAAMAGCGNGPNTSSDVKEAEDQAAAIYKAIEARDFNKAASLYSPLFYEHRNKEEWVRHLQALNKDLGNLKGYDLTKVIANSNFNGLFLTLKYKTHYTQHDAFEKMVFTTPPGGGKLQMVSHKVEMDTFDSGPGSPAHVAPTAGEQPAR